ncbi:uncharacterized protein LOC143767024 [Ranitomeya variabilis]|uniref:uncharacterized protein LOC143767024 n=1 Tax=Ranitomeya variabilis TaxID=490064 RepID=UPI004055E099
MIESNYMLECLVEDDSMNIQRTSLFNEEEHDIGNCEENVNIETEVSKHSGTIPLENAELVSDQAYESDEEMKKLLSDLKIKFGSNLENTDCFPSNPLVVDNQRYIEFDDNTEENRIGTVDWCQCGKCVPMPTNMESICCREISNAEEYLGNINCLTDHEYFTTFCEREATVNILVTTVCLDSHPPQNKIVNSLKRKTAYRAFTAWIHGLLGKGNRRPIPPCVVKLVREAFPDDKEEYMGFKLHNYTPAEFSILP